VRDGPRSTIVRMTSKAENPSKSRDIGDFERSAVLRREVDWALPMSERLARLHTLCKQMSAIKGAAARPH
jgi:hypothetical protein